jgi:CHASE domain
MLSCTGVIMICPVFKSANSSDNQPQENVSAYHIAVIRIEALLNEAVRTVNLQRDMVQLAVFDVTTSDTVDLKASNLTFLYKDDVPALSNVFLPDDGPHKFDVIGKLSTHGRTYQINYRFAEAYTDALTDQKVVLVPSVLAGLFILMDILILSTLALWKATVQSRLIQAGMLHM